jgi:hypothetical protein
MAMNVNDEITMTDEAFMSMEEKENTVCSGATPGLQSKAAGDDSSQESTVGRHVEAEGATPVLVEHGQVIVL